MKHGRCKVGKMEEECDCPACRGEIDMQINSDEMIEDFLVRTRRIPLVGEINEILSIHICSYLQMFSLGKEPIYMYINSPGGCLASGYAIVDQMLVCRCPIYTIVRGQAHSMAAIIAAFGEKGHRYATSNSSMMLHSLNIHNPPDSIERHAEMFNYLQRDYLNKITNIAKRLKLTAKQLEKLMSETRWMSPKQAIRIGLIDKIWTPNMEQAINRKFIK